MTTNQHHKDSFRVAQATKCGQCRTVLTRSEKQRLAEWCTRCADPEGYSDRLAVRHREFQQQRRQEMTAVVPVQADLWDDEMNAVQAVREGKG